MRDALELEARRNLYQHIRRDPGKYLRELQRDMEWGMGALEYHLAFLIRSGLVVENHEAKKRYYPAEIPSADRVVIGYLRQAPARHILLALLQRPMNRAELVDELGLSASAIAHHLTNLKRHDLIDGEASGREVRYRPEDPERVVRLLVAHRRSFLDVAIDRFLESLDQFG